MQERRSGRELDNGERRRDADIQDRVESFRLLRDKILLGFGLTGVAAITIASIVIGVKDSALALAALTLFGTILGAPAFLRLDERRDRSKAE